MAVEFLLRHWRRTNDPQALAVAEQTLQQMARGGMFDHLGGGFHRYSTDAEWLVPHFEKMLYDNAQLARAYLMGYQATGNAFFRTIAELVLTYVLRDLTDASGGFYSTEDADSEGEEGKFYVWRPAELVELLGDEDARLFGAFYDVTASGNFEHGASILHMPRTLGRGRAASWACPKPKLLEALERGRSAAVPGARTPHTAGARRKGAGGVERADAARVRRGWPGAVRTRRTSRPRSTTRSSCCRTCVGPTARCTGPGSPGTRRG